ncbi:hypothetical protein [Flavobacterium difficile]|uniref:Lipocalin-like domain-containing protein n=1 Tax=Flavobacterium difficile TaxID=2709659 RepID=A0ABX0I2L9_9FLAO|nr:hypothetical protein [Flavobacterium difficile]NHM00827.1 hypothetical protein [Flavobacterium difficile]
MKKGIQILLILCAMVIASCSNDNQENNNDTSPNPTGFVWRENLIDAPLNSASSAYFTAAFNTLIAKDANNITLFEINLTGASPGTYAIDNSSVLFTYTGVNPMYVATGGQVVITTNASGKISGTFEAFRSGTGLTRIYGSFTDVVMQ